MVLSVLNISFKMKRGIVSNLNCYFERDSFRKNRNVWLAVVSDT